MPPEPVVVVGAGLSGVACARELVAAGVPVRVVDRGRRIGGRMASRRLDGRPVDLGASYLTVGDDDFAAVVDDWARRGLAGPWTDRFTVLEPGQEPSAKDGPMRWGAPGGLRSLVEDLAAGLEVSSADVGSVVRDGDRLRIDGEPARAVVLAMPDAQAARVLGAGLDDVRERLDRAFEPVLALAAWWPTRTWDDVAPDGCFHAAFVNGDDVLDWVADDGRRRGDDAPVLVAHSGVEFARRHLREPEAGVAPMLAALRGLLDVADPAGTHLHRWSLAKPAGERDEPYLLTADEHRPVGVCGDGWGPSSKVETAWRSGRTLGRDLARRLTDA